MAFYKVHIENQVDSALPRDKMIVTPHFNVSSGTPTPATLANAIATAFKTWLATASPISVKVYTAGAGDSGPPLATKDLDTASPPLVSSVPREVCLCLSYFSSQNVKRQRGRLYIPFSWIKSHTASGTINVRPTAAQQTAVKEFATQVLMPQSASGAQWGFWSNATNSFRAVTDYWVDDEWDIQRRRGLRSTGRITGIA